jgi:hypothetical protein
MTTAQMTGLTKAQARLADRIAGEVEPALKGGAQGAAAHLTAQIASLTAVAASELPISILTQIGSQKDLFVRLVGVLKDFAKSGANDVVTLPTTVAKGSGLGTLVDVAEGRKSLNAYAVDVPLEDWAGPLAGSTDIERDLGIRRQTLNNWRQSGDVVAFLKGVSKHVYPLAQFVDGRPVKGLPEITAAAGGQRTAWLWLNEKNPGLGGKLPIDMLRRDEVEVVRQAARDYFLNL